MNTSPSLGVSETTATKHLLGAAGSPQLRPIRIPHDLTAVADLVELCFAPTLDEDGRRFIRQMRRAGSSRSALSALGSLTSSIRGFVWVEQDEIVGNLNLLAVRVRGQRAYLVANVSVHPDFRGRGIAHQMTRAAISMAETNSVRRMWLQVDENNLIAQQLYRDYDFVEQARRTLWHSRPELSQVKIPPSVKVKPARAADWRQQRHWLNRFYGPEVRWNLPFQMQVYAPGLIGGLLRLLGEQKIRQWSAFHRGAWIGSLTWQSSYAMADWLWLAAPPEKRSLAILSLIPQAYQDLRNANLLRPGRTLAVNFPAGDSAETFEAVGFAHHNTLIWMERVEA